VCVSVCVVCVCMCACGGGADVVDSGRSHGVLRYSTVFRHMGHVMRLEQENE
jgi:hypothetical protein